MGERKRKKPNITFRKGTGKTVIKFYRNNRNPHKYLEVHHSSCGHYLVKQFMMWGKVKNRVGDGCLHRWWSKNLTALLNDYVEVGVDELKMLEEKSFNRTTHWYDGVEYPSYMLE